MEKTDYFNPNANFLILYLIERTLSHVYEGSKKRKNGEKKTEHRKWE